MILFPMEWNNISLLPPYLVPVKPTWVETPFILELVK